MEPRLFAVSDTDLTEVMSWLTTADAVDRWSGPEFRFPYSKQSFREDCRLGAFSNFAFKNADGDLLAFGQIGDRYDRSHFARLIVSPTRRGQGMGKLLVGALLAQAKLRPDCDACGLFVYRRNTSAIHCYESMGFSVDEYPVSARLADECYYMTRRLG